MNILRWIFIGLFSAGLLLAQQPPTKKGSAQQPPTKKGSANAAPDPWKRQKECFQLARQNYIEMRREYPMPKEALELWRPHYNPKYGTCYMLVERGVGEFAGLRDVLERKDIAFAFHYWPLQPDPSLTSGHIRDRLTTADEAR